MKKHILLNGLFVCMGICLSIASSAQYSKFTVQFKNKNNSPYSLSNPLAYLSQRAIDRRLKTGVTIDSTDLPVNPSYIKKVMQQGSVTYLSQSKWLNDILIECTDSSALTAIRQLPFVTGVKPVYAPVALNATNNNNDKFNDKVYPPAAAKVAGRDSVYGYSYNQIHIHNGDFLHAKGFTGKGIIIAVLDAGFYHYRTTKAFDSARANKQILGERDFVEYDNSVNENNLHGEYCLSTIASLVPGQMVGSAPKASFWLIRTEDVGSEYPIEEHNWVTGAEFADSAGADIISSSLSYFGFTDTAFNHTTNDIYKNTATVSKGANYAAKKGMLISNSAGNSGTYPNKYIGFPSDADSVCTVGASDYTGTVADFSSYGYPGRVKPNIASVGKGTYVYAYNGITTADGTSFSTPNMSGLMACLWQAFPQATNADILKAVYASSSQLKHPDNRIGYGLPDMKKAYTILKNKFNKDGSAAFANTDASVAQDHTWLHASPVPFSNAVTVQFTAQETAKISLSLTGRDGAVIQTKALQVQKGQPYTTTFAVNNALPDGVYYIRYNGKALQASVKLVKGQ